MERLISKPNNINVSIKNVGNGLIILLKVRSSFFNEVGVFDDENLKLKIYYDYILGQKSPNPDQNPNFIELTREHDQIMEEFLSKWV